MRIIFRRVGFLGWRWVWCVIAHRPFYVQDMIKAWYCAACMKGETARIQKGLHT